MYVCVREREGEGEGGGGLIYTMNGLDHTYLVYPDWVIDPIRTPVPYSFIVIESLTLSLPYSRTRSTDFVSSLTWSHYPLWGTPRVELLNTT